MAESDVEAYNEHLLTKDSKSSRSLSKLQKRPQLPFILLGKLVAKQRRLESRLFIPGRVRCWAGNGHRAIVGFLHCTGTSQESEACTGCTPTHEAAWAGQRAALQILTDRGANKEIIITYEWTPLHAATSNGRKAAMQMLLGQGT